MSKIKPEDIKEFKRIAKELARLIIKVRGYCPDSCLYFAESVLHLMSGPDQLDLPNSVRSVPNHKAIEASEIIPNMGGGDW